MVGESGTGTSRVYRYYKCANTKKTHICDKKPVRKEWIEDLAVKAALEKEKKELEITILQEKIKKPFLTKEQIRFGIEKFGKLDISTKEGKQRLIDGFINAIYVYDDKITFTFNYKDGTRTVMLSELSDGKNNSDLKCQGAPRKRTGRLPVLFRGALSERSRYAATRCRRSSIFNLFL